MLYIITMILSLFNLTLNIIMPFCDEESDIFKFYGDFKTNVLLCISIVTLIVAIILDKVKEIKEDEEQWINLSQENSGSV